MASHPDNINTSETFTQDFLALADKKGVDFDKLRGELSYLRQLHKQPQPQITLAEERPFYFSLPDELPKIQKHVKVKTATPVKETDTHLDKQAESAPEKQTKEQMTAQSKVQKNDVNITLSSPDSAIQEAALKPKEGEEKQILLQ